MNGRIANVVALVLMAPLAAMAVWGLTRPPLRIDGVLVSVLTIGTSFALLYRLVASMNAPSIDGLIEALYEPGETTVQMEQWLDEDEPESDKSSSWLSLTQERLYIVTLESGRISGLLAVSSFESLPLSAVTSWSFDKTKTTRGHHTGYTFSLTTERSEWSFWTSADEAEPFIQDFKATMARFTALAAPIDMAAQLRALQALVQEGVLNPTEMQRAKELFLGRPPDERQVMERNLRSLYELKKGGVLSQIEFEIKKRDIIATTR